MSEDFSEEKGAVEEIELTYKDMDYQIPEAILRFRLGFGRLIRNMSDSGICIISDTRLYSRRYGEIILNSFPLEPIPYQNVDSLLSQSQKFFLT